jgi:hypothetical protein
MRSCVQKNLSNVSTFTDFLIALKDQIRPAIDTAFRWAAEAATELGRTPIGGDIKTVASNLFGSDANIQAANSKPSHPRVILHIADLGYL